MNLARTPKLPSVSVLARLRLAFLLALAACAGGCAHVPPYAREDLTRPGMESESEAEEGGFRPTKPSGCRLLGAVWAAER